MLKCLFMKRKLYDYADNNLSDLDKIKVGSHLDVCAGCRERLEQIKSIIELAAQKISPEPSEEFWHDFKTGLDRKLNQRLTSPLVIGHPLKFSFNPVLAYALVLVFVVAIGSIFYNSYHYSRLSSVNDDVLANDVVVLEEVSQTPVLSHDKDSYIEEIKLLYQLGQNSI